MVPVKQYEGIVRGDVVVLSGRPELPEGTPVLVFPRMDLEDQWLTIPDAVETFDVSLTQLLHWVESGKVRGAVGDPRLVNAGDIEDAVEQNDLYLLAMDSAATEEED